MLVLPLMFTRTFSTEAKLHNDLRTLNLTNLYVYWVWLTKSKKFANLGVDIVYWDRFVNCDLGQVSLLKVVRYQTDLFTSTEKISHIDWERPEFAVKYIFGLHVILDYEKFGNQCSPVI